MHRVLVLSGIALVSVATYAQQTKPGVAVPPNTPGYTYGKSEDAAEARKNKRQQGKVRPAGGDAPKSAEGGAVGNDKAAVAGEARAKTRDARKPNRAPTTQGPTPNDAVLPAH